MVSDKKKPEEEGQPKQSLEMGVRDWLSTHGLPLEMTVASELATAGCEVIQSNYYRDSEGDKYREIDAVGTKYVMRYPKEFRVGYSFVVECKASPKKPWLLIQGDHVKRAVRFGEPASKNIVTQLAMAHFERQEQSVDYEPDGVTFGPERTSAVCVTAFRERDQPDPAYEAMLACCKAALHIRSSSTYLASSPASKTCHLWVPLVVIDAKLFEVMWTSEKELGIAEARWGRVLFRQPSAGGPTIVDIVTVGELRRYLTRACRELDDLLGGRTVTATPSGS